MGLHFQPPETPGHQERGSGGVPKLRVVTFKADAELLEQVDELARSLGITRSALIKQAIRQFLQVSARGRRAGKHGRGKPVETRRIKVY